MNIDTHYQTTPNVFIKRNHHTISFDHNGLFCFAYFLLICDDLVLRKSNISDLLSNGITNLLSNLFMMTFFGVIIFDWIKFRKFRRNELIIVVAVVIIFGISAYISRTISLFKLILMVITAKNIDFDNLVNLYYKFIIYLTIILSFFSLSGIISIGYRYSSVKKARFSLGYGHPNHLGLIAFVFLAAYFYKNRNNKKRYLLSFIFSAFFYLITKDRTQIICSLLLIIFIYFHENLYLRIKINKNLRKYITRIIIFTILLFAIIVIIFLFINPSILPTSARNLSIRFLSARYFLDTYGLKLFGNHMTWGNGSSTQKWLDSGYFRIPIQNGLLVFLIVIFLFWRGITLSIKYNNWMLTIIYIVILIFATTERSVFLLCFNLFMTTLYYQPSPVKHK